MSFLATLSAKDSYLRAISRYSSRVSRASVSPDYATGTVSVGVSGLFVTDGFMRSLEYDLSMAAPLWLKVEVKRHPRWFLGRFNDCGVKL